MIVYLKDRCGKVVMSWDADEIEVTESGSFALLTLGHYHFSVKLSEYPNGYVLDVRRKLQ